MDWPGIEVAFYRQIVAQIKTRELKHDKLCSVRNFFGTAIEGILDVEDSGAKRTASLLIPPARPKPLPTTHATKAASARRRPGLLPIGTV
jgi:hypothetical protein